MNTILLDKVNWDLVVNAAGNIATAFDSAPVSTAAQKTVYALAQDAASAIRLFQSELWFDTTQGIPYFDQILGKKPSVPLMKAYFVRAAKTVPGIVSAVCYIEAIANRVVTGQVQVFDANGNTATAAF